MNFITDVTFNIKWCVKILLIIMDWPTKGIVLILVLLISVPAIATAFIKYYIPYHGFRKGNY